MARRLGQQSNLSRGSFFSFLSWSRFGINRVHGTGPVVVTQLCNAADSMILDLSYASIAKLDVKVRMILSPYFRDGPSIQDFHTSIHYRK